MKPEQLDLSDENSFTHRLIDLNEFKKNKPMAISLSVIVAIVICFFFCQVILIGLNSGWPVFLLILLPMIVSSVITIHNFLKVDIVNAYGVFVTNQKGMVKRGFLWTDIEKISYKVVNGEETKSLKLIIMPHQGRPIQFNTVSLDLAAHFYVLCHQYLPNGENTLNQFIASLEDKKQRFGDSFKHKFEMKVRELAYQTITFEHLNHLTELESKALLDDIKIHQRKRHHHHHDSHDF